MKKYSYQNYVISYDNRESSGKYNYKYRDSMREMDRLLFDELRSRYPSDAELTIIDLGCGNGNFLYHVKSVFPRARLAGKDLAGTTISHCKEDPALQGIEFACGDLTEPPPLEERHKFDVVILIAVLSVFPPDVLSRALENISMYLKPGGRLLNIDGYHDFGERDYIAVEIYPNRSVSPDLDVMKYVYPSKPEMTRLLHDRGFADVSYRDFSISFCLDYPHGNPFGTHTIECADGKKTKHVGFGFSAVVSAFRRAEVASVFI
jgi:SAM-dependent methyltransferase